MWMRGCSKSAGETAETRALAPAMAVVLLVVITVVLSMTAMAGLLVFPEETSEPAPEAVLAVDVGPDGNLMVEHRGGDTIDTDQLGFVGPVPEEQSFDTETLSAGERITIDVLESGTGALVWQADDGDLTTRLKQFDVKQSEAPAQGNWTVLRTKLENDEDITLQHDYTSNSPGYDEVFESVGHQINGDYEGTLDGNGHEIRDITIDAPFSTKAGFIGILRQNGVVKNLDVTNFTVTGARDVGFIGANWGGTVNSVSVEGATVNSTGFGGHSKAGMLVGDNDGTIQNSFVSGTIKGNNKSIGGLAGENTGTIADSSAEGDVDGYDKGVGGLVGIDGGGEIIDSYATGDVDGEKRVGGLAGHNRISWYNNPVTITDSYATGDVSASGDRVGGLVGLNKGQIETSFAVGEVTGASHVGGLVGDTGGIGTVTDSYWDTNTTGQSSSDGGTGLTTANMTGSDATSLMSGFEFNSVWDTSSSPTDYPVLQALDEQTQLEAKD